MNMPMNFGHGVFEWVLQTSWQAAVLTVLILAVQWLFRKRLSPSWRYGLWMLLAVRLIMPTLPASGVSIFNFVKIKPEPIQHLQPAENQPPTNPIHTATGGTRIEPDRFAASSANQPLAVDSPHSQVASQASPPKWSRAASQFPQSIPWRTLGFGLWLTGTLGFGLRLVWTHLRFCSRLRGHIPVVDPDMALLFTQCRDAMHVKAGIALIETVEVNAPAVYGLWRKRLLLPDGIFEDFSQEEIRHIFLHELAHVKRHDLEVHWMMSALLALHWFNPLLWLAFRRMRADRELATDALALAHANENNAIPYGETILKVLEGLTEPSGVPGLVGIAESKQLIEERLYAIADYGAGKPWKWAALGLTAGLAVVTLTSANRAEQASANQRLKGSVPMTETIAAGGGNQAPKAGQKRFEIRVIDFESSAALSGTKVQFELEDYSGSVEKQERTTGSDGTATLEFNASDLKRFAYRLERSDYLSIRGEWFKQQIVCVPEKLEVKLAKGLEIGGFVKDEQGNPVAGAEITFNGSMSLMLSGTPINNIIWNPRAGDRLAVTDANGVWKARCIWPTAPWASLRIHHPDFGDAAYSTETTKAMQAEGKGMQVVFDDLAQHRARFTLTRGASVYGRVLDLSGTGKPGLKVRYAESENFSNDASAEGASVTTDASGKFRIDHLPKDPISLVAQTDGFAPAVLEIVPQALKGEVRLRLNPGQPLKGRTVDNEGDPVPGVRIKFQEWSTWHGVQWETVSDRNGEFQWNDAPRSKFQLAFEKEGFIATSKIIQNDKTQIIQINPALKITGNIRDALTKKPIQRFHIIWADREEFLQYNRRYAVSGANGILSLDLNKLHEQIASSGYPYQFLFRVEADGYQPVLSRQFASHHGDVGQMAYDIDLEPANQISGTVVDAAGHPVAGAQIGLKDPTSRLRLAGKPAFENLDSIPFPVTDTNGKFRVTNDPDATHLFVVHEKGFAAIESKNFAESIAVKLQPWGKVQGTVQEYDKALKDQRVFLYCRQWDEPDPRKLSIPFIQFEGTTDNQGRFSFNYVPPSKCDLHRMVPLRQGGASGPKEVVVVKSGQTMAVKLGGGGRPVTGRIKVANPYVPIDWKKENHFVHSEFPKAPEDIKTAEEKQSWRKRPEVQTAIDKIRSYPMQFSEDGSFRIDEMIPGKYFFDIALHDPRDPGALAFGRYIANFSANFEVPGSPEENSQKPLDVGVFEMALNSQFEEGETAAPDFTVKDMNGKEFKLSDFRGKYVLLDFWATWCSPCVGELPYLKKTHEIFGKRDDFVMVSLSLDKTMEDVSAFVKKNDMPWIQGYLGDWTTTQVPSQYGVTGIPASFLVSPEGKILAQGLSGSSLSRDLGKFLK